MKMNKQEYMDDFQNNQSMNDSLENTYQELQTPLLLALLYFLFQLPIFKSVLFKYFPFLCKTDGNYNLNGLIITSILFGFIYYIITKTMNIFNRF